MKAPEFAYVRARSVPHALALLAEHEDDAAVLAGGQSLMPMLNLRVAGAGLLIDINRLSELSGIEDRGDYLAIGALTRYVDLLASVLVREHLPLLTAALPHVAHEAVRNRGTIGGSLVLADPAAEMPACILTLGAILVVQGPTGLREIPADEWFSGLYETALAPGELLVEVRIPKADDRTVYRFCELARRRGDFAIVGLALVFERRDGVIAAPRLGLMGAADRPILARGAMRAIDGVRLDTFSEVLPAALLAALDSDMDPLDDPACPISYRRHAMAVLLRRVLSSLTGEDAAVWVEVNP